MSSEFIYGISILVVISRQSIFRLLKCHSSCV